MHLSPPPLPYCSGVVVAAAVNRTVAIATSLAPACYVVAVVHHV